MKSINRRQIKGGIVGLIGFILSPLTWWNDAFVNLPLAILFGWLVSLVYEPAFEVATVVGYWLTNLVGLILLRRGARDIFAAQTPAERRKEWVNDLAVSLIYTLLIVILLRLKLVAPWPDYFK